MVLADNQEDFEKVDNCIQNANKKIDIWVSRPKTGLHKKRKNA
jgi:hypothetical protein